MERDPVCGTTIRPGLEAANLTYQGHTYHFCSVECRDLFRANPAQYVERTATAELDTNPLRGAVLAADIFVDRAAPKERHPGD